MKKLTKNILATSILAALGMSSAFAAEATANFTANSTIAAACTVAATNVAFGSITPAATGNAVATGTLTSVCTKSTAYTLNLNVGSTTGGTYAQRQMAGTTGNTDKLNYNLYTANTYENIFGNGSTGTSNVALTGTGAAQTTTVYGQLPLNQYLKPDTYTDNLTVTLSY